MSQDYLYQDIKGQKYGYPVDEWGHLLDKNDIRGKQARDLTSPYGALEYAIGNGDSFACFDYAILDNGLVALHAVVNSETGGFIQDFGYEVVPLNEAPGIAMGMMDAAFEGVRHSRRGWDQDEWFFYRSVCLAVARARGIKVPAFSSRQRRFGGKKIDAFIRWACGA